VRKAFESAVNSERFILVYDNARHNVGGNPPPPEALSNFAARAFFDEPVWRKDRIVAINQHFISAFLDTYLKHENRLEYLTPLNSGNPSWKGFQRRWALGFDVKHYSAGQAAK
jgi:hypothetical protein